MSSREFITLLDGMPPDSWYKQSLSTFVERAEKAEKLKPRYEVHRIFAAQLRGQKIEVAK